MPFKSLVGLSALGATIIVGAITQPAEAISFLLGDAAANQASMTGIAGFNGETNQGAYSIYAWTEGFNTVTFNNKDFTVVNHQNQVVSDPGIQYSFVGSNGNKTKIVKDNWAPSFEAPRDNKSNYLTAFSGSSAQIDLGTTHNYFGINWGSAHDGNEFSFYNGDQLVQRFVYYGDNRSFAPDTRTTNVASALAAYGVKGNGNQYNAYFNFFADSSADLFNRIVITQLGGGGFETDNHTFKAGTRGFNEPAESVPEPAAMLGLVVVGGALIAKRRSGQTELG